MIIDKLPQMDASVAEMVKDFTCPECRKSYVNETTPTSKPNMVGWCETEYGYMIILECPFCFAKFRTHANTGDKFDLGDFESALECWVMEKYVANYKDYEV